MKPIALVFCVLAAMSIAVKAQNIDNPPIQVECVTNWCEVVQGPSGTYPYTNIIVGPGTNVCLYTWICAWPEMDWRCDTNVLTLSRWAPETTNCPPQRWTNTVCPFFLTNWWVVSSPGFSASGQGVGVCFQPTNCGPGTITLYGIWANLNPCTGELYNQGTTSQSISFRVVNVDIAEESKAVCACDTASFTLTNSCGETVTWEVLTNGVPGEPTVNGSSILAGTNCGTWLVIARSTTNPNCADSAGLTVYGVESLAPAGLTREGTNEPPTYITCPRATDAPDRWVRVTAMSCPWVSEESSCTNLPPCWQITGGHRAVMAGQNCTNRLAVEVDLSQKGTHTVIATAGCSSQSVVIIVQDTNPPVLYCPGDLTFCTDARRCFATVDLNGYVSASDNCGSVTMTFAPSGPQFGKGTNTVTATARDVAGNTTNCTFNVIVNDCESPQIVCPQAVTVNTSPGLCYATNVPLGQPRPRDNCGVASVVNDAPSQFPLGTTIVTWTVTRVGYLGLGLVG